MKKNVLPLMLGAIIGGCVATAAPVYADDATLSKVHITMVVYDKDSTESVSMRCYVDSFQPSINYK